MSNGDTSPTLKWSLFAVLCILAFGVAIRLVAPAVGTAIGLAIAIASGGIAATGTMAPWILPITAGGIALVGGGTTVILLQRVVKVAEREPFRALSPILSVCGGLMVNLSQELYPSPGVPGIVYAAIAAAAFEGGGILFRRPEVSSRILGGVLVLLPLGLLLGNAIAIHWTGDLATALAGISAATWLLLGILTLVLVGIAVLARLR